MKGILETWAKNGIRTIEAARAEETAFRNQQQRNRQNNRPKEVVPDWFIERKKRQQVSKPQATTQTPEEIAETERLLAKYRSKSKSG